MPDDGVQPGMRACTPSSGGVLQAVGSEARARGVDSVDFL